jgi:hypothetical protein
LPRYGNFRYKLDEYKEFLLAHIYEWRFHSLEGRADILRSKFPGLEVSGWILGRWYRRNRCIYTRPGYHITNSFSIPEMQELQ